MRTQIVGLGGFGSRIVNKVVEQHPNLNASFVAIDSDAEALRKLTHIEHRHLLGKGEGCLGVFDYGLALAIKHQEELDDIIDGDKVLFVSGCGATGWGLLKYISILTVGGIGRTSKIIFQCPFPFEGEIRKQKASNLLNGAKQAVITIKEPYFPEGESIIDYCDGQMTAEIFLNSA